MANKKPIENGPDHAGVQVSPPLIFFGFLMVGLSLGTPWSEGRLAPIPQTFAGAIIAVLGLALIIVNAMRHKKAGSNVEPWKPTTTIITTGFYAYSRNPIYLGMAITYAGIAVAAASVAALVNLLVAMLVTQFYVIAREEDYLETKFGQVYLDYKNKVRRWI